MTTSEPPGLEICNGSDKDVQPRPGKHPSENTNQATATNIMMPEVSLRFEMRFSTRVLIFKAPGSAMDPCEQIEPDFPSDANFTR